VEAGGRLLGLIPVAEHEARVGARDAEHPLLVRPDLGPRPRVEQLDVVPRLREAGRPWPEGAVPGLAEVVGALRHAEALVDVEAEALAPSLKNRLREMLARAHAVPQRGHVGARGARLLQDLPVDGGHADEDGGIVPRDEPRPERRVARPLMHDRGVAPIERVHQAGAEHVGPVELARVEDAVALGRKSNQ